MSMLAKADTDFAHQGFQTIIPAASQKLTTSASSQQLSFAAATTCLRIQCDQDVYIARGTNPTANTTTSMFLKGQTVEFIGILLGEKLAVIEASTPGTFWVTEAL